MSSATCKQFRCAIPPDKFLPLRQSDATNMHKATQRSEASHKSESEHLNDVILVHAHALKQSTDFAHLRRRPLCLQTRPSSSPPQSSPSRAPQRPQSHQTGVRSCWCHIKGTRHTSLSEQLASQKKTASSWQISPRLQQHTPHMGHSFECSAGCSNVQHGCHAPPCICL